MRRESYSRAVRAQAQCVPATHPTHRRRHRRSAACRRPVQVWRPQRRRARRDGATAPLRSHPVRCGSRGSSADRRRGRRIRAPHLASLPRASAPDRRCGTDARLRRRDRRENARHRDPDDPDSRAPRRDRRCTARRSRLRPPAAAAHRAHADGCRRSHGRSERCWRLRRDRAEFHRSSQTWCTRSGRSRYAASCPAAPAARGARGWATALRRR